MLRDNIDLFREWDAVQSKRLERLPKCCYCGEPIQDGYCYEIDGETMCRECLDDNFRKELET